MATKIYTEIEINANAEKVWNTLTDISKHEDWNTLFKVNNGRFVKDTKLDITINDMGFKPKVLTVDANKKLVWLGRLLFPGLFDGKSRYILHRHRISPEELSSSPEQWLADAR